MVEDVNAHFPALAIIPAILYLSPVDSSQPGTVRPNVLFYVICLNHVSLSQNKKVVGVINVGAKCRQN